ncbi:hypothetical protein BGZ70_009977, partial [Mortierella alpina]
MSKSDEHESSIKELLETLAGSSEDIQPKHIADLSTALITAVANAAAAEGQVAVRAQQKEYLARCASLLSKEPSAAESQDEGTFPLLQVQGAACLDADPKSPPSTSLTTAAATGVKMTRFRDLKPMVAILLAKAFETTSNKDHARDRSAEIVLVDIGSDKIKTRTAGFQALGIIVQADMTIGCEILNKEGLLVELMDCI